MFDYEAQIHIHDLVQCQSGVDGKWGKELAGTNIVSVSMDVMPEKKHHIRLGGGERKRFETILRKGKANAHCQRHARILLLADTEGPEGDWSDSRIASTAHNEHPHRGVGAARLRRAADRRGDQPRDGASDAKKTNSSRGGKSSG